MRKNDLQLHVKRPSINALIMIYGIDTLFKMLITNLIFACVVDKKHFYFLENMDIIKNWLFEENFAKYLVFVLL